MSIGPRRTQFENWGQASYSGELLGLRDQTYRLATFFNELVTISNELFKLTLLAGEVLGSFYTFEHIGDSLVEVI